MDIIVNGIPRSAPDGATLLQLLGSLGLNPATVVVERNGAVVARGAYGTMTLARADRLEIVRFVGGG
jgi:thiamine biosynthesis protein ThiS